MTNQLTYQCSQKYVINLDQKYNISTNKMPYNYNKHVAHLPDGVYKITEEYVNDIAEYCTEGFLKYNDVWADAHLDQQMLLNFFRKQVKDHIESEKRVEQFLQRKLYLNSFKVYNGKLISSLLSYQIYEYKKHLQNSVPSQIPLFRQLEKQGKQLIKCIDLDSFERGKHIYCSWATMHYDGELAKGHKNQVSVLTLGLTKDSGIQSLMFRSSNYKIYKVIEHVGGKLLKQTGFSKNGKDYKLYFIQLALNTQQFSMTYDFLKKREKQRQLQNQQPKL